MAADRWIALGFLVFSIAYGWAAWTYPILPFERFSAIKPNTLPIGLAFACGALSLLVLLGKSETPSEVSDDEGLTLRRLHHYAWGQALGLIGFMIVYALALRPLGFLLATTLFLGGSAYLLGERRFTLLVPVVLIGTVGIWYLVDEALGIFLRPWPAILGV